MDVKGKVTNTSLLFYIENVQSPYGQLKGYYTFIKKMHSSEYDTFLRAYCHYRDNLNQPERTVLDFVYAIHGEILTLREIGDRLDISDSRVAQIRNKAERSLSSLMMKTIHGIDHTKPRKQSFVSIISVLPDEVLIKLLQATRPWEPIVQYYNEKGQLSYKRRRGLEHKLFRVWHFDMLDHREKLIKLLNIDRAEIKWD